MERMETEAGAGAVVVGGVRRRPYASRRRTRSTGSLPPPFVWQQHGGGGGPSEDSSSSVGDGKGLSDSDDVQPMGLRQPHPARLAPPLHHHHLMESDSVNENFSPVRPSTRRKRKFKRLAVDVEVGAGVAGGGGGGGSQRPPMSCMLVSSGKKKRVLRHVPNCDNRYCLTGASCGKRKRSVRTDMPPSARAMGFATPAARDDTTSALHRLSLRDPAQPQPMDVSGSLAHQQLQPTSAVVAGGSSVSSSESDTGVFTNDEGREGDDEQSDWFGEAKGWWADSDRDEDMEPTFAAILGGATTIDTAKGKGREIRGGRRRVRAERPSFSVFTSANEQLSKFLQDPARSELKLHPMQRREREQLCHLADLYSLNMRVSDGLTCPVLTKTSNTVRVEQLPLCRLSSMGDCKRRRRAAAATDGGSGHRSSPPDTTRHHHHHHNQLQLLGHKSS